MHPDLDDPLGLDPVDQSDQNLPVGRRGHPCLAPRAAARRLGPTRLRGATYETLFGLIASTGLRVSEAVDLQDADVDLKSGMLTIRRTKFAKSRQIPVHASTTNALKRYRALRNHHIEITDETPFFVGTRGRHRGVD